MPSDSRFFFNKAAALADLISWKNSVADFPSGGAKDGVDYDPRTMCNTTQQEQVDMRTAALALAIPRVGRATLSRTQVNSDLGLGVQP